MESDTNSLYCVLCHKPVSIEAATPMQTVSPSTAIAMQID
jgi:hypothetical protein